MVDQRRPQRASVYQSKYDTYAKPVLLSQPETQERPKLLYSSNDQEFGALPQPSARKPTPGKLNLDKIRTFSQDDWTATPVQDPLTGSLAARKAPENSGSGSFGDNTGKEDVHSPGSLDLPNGTPLSRHPSDAVHSQGTSPKALPDIAMAPGQITIVAEAVAQYEQKILQGQRQRRGRFSSTSTPDVSRHASVCSSEHPTPREHQPLVRSAAEAGSASTEHEHGNHTAGNGSASHEAGHDQDKAVEGHVSAPGLSQSPRQAKGAAAEQPDVKEDDVDTAAAAAAASGSASGRQYGPDSGYGGKRDEASSAAAAPLSTQRGSGGDAISKKQSGPANTDCAQQPAERSDHRDAAVLPVSTRASALPAAEPEQRYRQGAAAAPAGSESACSATSSSRRPRQTEPGLHESVSQVGWSELVGGADAALHGIQSSEDSQLSSTSANPELGAATPRSPSIAGRGERSGIVDAPGARAVQENPSRTAAVNATPQSSTPAAPTRVPECTTGAAPSSTPGSRGAAEAEPAARSGSAAPGLAERAGARHQAPLRGWQLSPESAREPEWVAAFRQVVSLAVNTPLSQTPAARRTSLANGWMSGSGATPSPLGDSRASVGQAPSPSSEGPADGGAAAGCRTGASSGRNLDTAFESALTDCRRKRLRADESPHSSGSEVRAAAAVQRAAERATLDRNGYSGACISAEAASALSPGAIALVNGRTAAQHSRVELQAQLNDVVHQLRFCLASMTEQQRPLLHAINTLQQGTKVPRKDLSEAAEKLQEAERLRRWSEIAQSENIARLLGIVAELQAAAQARAEEVHLSAPAWINLLLGGDGRSANAAGRLGRC